MIVGCRAYIYIILFNMSISPQKEQQKMQVGRINQSVNTDLENVVKVKNCGNFVEIICNN